MPAGDFGTQAYGNLSVGDVDAFRFTIDSQQDLLAWTGPGLFGPVGDTVLGLYDSNGTLVVEVDDGAQLTHGYYSLMQFGNLASGSYELRVRAFAPSIVGSYTLDLVTGAPGSLVARSTLRPTFSSAEPNDPRTPGGHETPVGAGTRSDGLISVAGATDPLGPAASADYDWYAFSVSNAGIVTLVTGPPAQLTQAAVQDTIVYIVAFVNPDYRVLAVNDDDGPSGYSRLRHYLGPGNYFAVVGGKSGTGAYSLEIIGPPPAPASATVATVHDRGVSTCASSGLPILLGTHGDNYSAISVSPERPILGSTFCLDVLNVVPGQGVWTLLGGPNIGRQQLPFGTSCYTEIVTDTPPSYVQARTDGTVFWLLSIPLSPALAGSTFQAQAASFDPVSIIALSNRVEIRCGTQF